MKLDPPLLPLEPAAEYQPAPPRAFKSRGGLGKNATYKHDWYLANRESILTDRHAKYKKTERTSEWKAKSHRRRSAAKKRSWKNLAAEHRANSLRGLEIGAQKKRSEYEERRRQVAWDVFRGRLNGIGVRSLRSKYGKIAFGILANAGLAGRKGFVTYRTQIFRRASGTELRKSLGDTALEFAKRISTPGHAVSAKRPLIWLTSPEKSLNPVEARECIALCDRIALKLLSNETIRQLSPLDRYSRPEVLVTLFPRLRSEYKLLLETIPELSAFLKAHDSCSEKDLGFAVFELAEKETRGELKGNSFRALLRWFPRLVPWIVENQARFRVAQGFKTKRSLALDMLAAMSFCSPKIVRSAVSNQTGVVEPRRMRGLMRVHFPSSEGKPAVRSKGGAPKKAKPETVIFAESVLNVTPRFEQGKQLAGSGIAALCKAGFSESEIECILGSRTAKTAAIRWTCKRNGIEFRTGKNYFSSFLASRKEPNHERHE